MKILFCSPHAPVKELGAPKVLLELIEGLRDLGHHCDVIGPAHIGAGSVLTHEGAEDYRRRLRDYLLAHAAEYDVVDYDHEYLPYPRADFPASPLMVARSVLLVQFMETIRLPQAKGLRALAARLLKSRRRARHRDARIAAADATVLAADLVNVANAHDRRELIRRGVSSERIAVIPYGISASRRAAFDGLSVASPAFPPKLAFVGTFDYRKGGPDMPAIVRTVRAAFPEATFKFLGTAGLFQTAEQVYAFFPPQDRRAIQVVPRFPAEQLPELLRDCHVGFFPSYWEGFGFGVLEMLAAALPVVAYDAPGPPEMLPPEYLCPSGDAMGLGRLIVALLRDPVRLASARAWARQRSHAFNWPDIARATADAYTKAVSQRRT